MNPKRELLQFRDQDGRSGTLVDTPYTNANDEGGEIMEIKKYQAFINQLPKETRSVTLPLEDMKMIIRKALQPKREDRREEQKEEERHTKRHCERDMANGEMRSTNE